jgi:2-methylcitrate dehydratase PrpD
MARGAHAEASPSTPGAALLRLVLDTRDEDLPKAALEHARLAVLDWWGVTVGGADEPVARLLRQTAGTPPGPAAVLGTPERTAPLTAALVNGAAAHALDYDDTTLALPGHLTAPLLPGLLAAAEARRLGGRALLTAFVLGVELASRVARALAPGHYRAGWHATATVGRLGGAAAIGRLLGLDQARLDAAVGLAAAQAGGIQEAFGSMAKPFQVGRAAADALLAALAAEAGLTGPSGILDRESWARRLSPTWEPARLTDGLGQRWAIGGLFFKRYPCCFATHASIAGLLALRPTLAPAAIETVELEVCPTTLQVAAQRGPVTGLGGKFSMTYCAAAALVRGHVGEDDFTDVAVADPAVRALADRVRVTADASLDETRARVRIRLAAGESRERAADLVADDPVGLRRDLTAKFRTLTAPRLGEATAERLVAAIEALDRLDDLRELTGPR